MNKNKKTTSGYVLLEAIIALVVFVIVVLSIFPMLSFLLKRTERSKYGSAASVLLQEGTEVAYHELATNWACCGIDGNYKVVFAASSIHLIPGTESGLLQTRFSRNITVEKACRDQTGNLIFRDNYINNTCPGVLDGNSRVITTTISWDEGGQNKNIASQLMVFNIQTN